MLDFVAVNAIQNAWTWIVQTYSNIHMLRTVGHWMDHGGGYGVLFGLLLSCGLGVPLPEDIPLLLAGYFVADGKMNLVMAAVCAWCGIIGGDSILYWLSRRFGMNISRVPVLGSHISLERMKWAHEKFEKYGFWVVAVGRLFAGVRGAMVITAGIIKFTFSHFIVADGIAAIISGGLFLGIGYAGRKKFGDLEQIRAEIEKYQHLLLIVVVVIVLAFAGWKWWQNIRRVQRKQKAIRQAQIRAAASKHI